ncbi:unnamed protein product [Pedinophyceae sp. YPF-701]|nr:unnamed protein product [Pedinophyceae sp. YPF-701]
MATAAQKTMERQPSKRTISDNELAREVAEIKAQEARDRRKKLLGLQEKKDKEQRQLHKTKSGNMAERVVDGKAVPAPPSANAASPGGFRVPQQERITDIVSREANRPAKNIGEAAARGDTKLMEVFIEQEKSPFDANKKDAMGRTPLHWAAEGGSMAAMMMLLELGADPEVTDYHNGLNALHFAARAGREGAVRFLINLMPKDKRDRFINSPDKRGCTPAFLAHELGVDGEPTFKLLLEMGARWNSQQLTGPAPKTTTSAPRSYGRA